MPRKYFGTDGIRGEVGIEPLTDQFFIILGAAIATGFSIFLVNIARMLEVYLLEKLNAFSLHKAICLTITFCPRSV